MFARLFTILALVVACLPLNTEAQNEIAVVAFIKKGSVQFRWVPNNSKLHEVGNNYGYKIERITLTQYKESTTVDSVKFKNGIRINAVPIKPFKKEDVRWNGLIAKNKAAGLLYNSLYAPAKAPNPTKKEMAFALLMKTCDLDRELAEAHGLIFKDSVFDENIQYVYRISPTGSPKGLTCKAALIEVNPKAYSHLAPIESLKAKWGDKKVVLSFNTLNQKSYGGYWIERSEDSLTYKAVNKNPFIRSTTKITEKDPLSYYDDSLPENDKKYFYRVRGISFFGELGNSDVVSGMGHAGFTSFPFIDSCLVKKESVLLHFHMDKAGKDLLQGFYVFRAEKKNSRLQLISSGLSPAGTTFEDKAPLLTNYYKIAAVNKYGDTAWSMSAYAKLVDETPPLPPQELVGKIDSNGVVRLTWKMNTEKDFQGYRVYRCNNEKEQPFELTKELVTGTSFKDSISLQTLTRHVFYTLRSVDKNYNNSTYSAYCKLMRPDKIAPVAVLFHDIKITDTNFVLNWHNSSSGDVKLYILYKKENSADWKKTMGWSSGEKRTSLTDSTLNYGATYKYKLEVVDESGNRTATETHSLLYSPAFVPAIKTLKVMVNREKRCIELDWASAGKNVYTYTIYKAKGNGSLTAWKTTGAEELQLIDKEIYPNNGYRYAIKATLKTGAETRLSQPITVEY